MVAHPSRMCPLVAIPQVFGSTPMRSLTAARMPCLHPRYRSVVCTLQIVIEQLYGFRRQRQEAKFVAFAMNAKLCFGKQQVAPDRSPCRSIKPTMAKSRVVRKLNQKRATSSTESGTRWRLGAFTRSRLIATRGRPRPIGLRRKNA